MNTKTKSFISNAFGPDYANDLSTLRNSLRLSLSGIGPFTETVKIQRDGFAEVISKRELSLTEWENLTEGVIDFSSEDDMYAFLQKAYDYIFGESDEPPPLPDGS